MRIRSAVGPGRPNRRADVEAVQALLNRARAYVGGQGLLEEDGLFGPRTAAAIGRYQSQQLRFKRPDGVVDPGGPTLRSLGTVQSGNTVAGRSPPFAGRLPSVAATPPRSRLPDRNGISEAAYVDMARRLDCEVAAIKAVVQTELALLGPFDSLGRPRILFERHKFHHHTGGRFDAAYPDISHPRWGGHGKMSEQYPKLERAMRLDRSAALKSASWGAFQILGENHAQAGHRTVDSFVRAMKSGVFAQADAFVAFVQHDRRLLAAIRQRNWATFARIYNGPAYRDHNYDGRMRSNYHRLANGG